MPEPSGSPLKTSNSIPELFAKPALAFGKTYGIPGETVAFVMGGVLGGIMSGAIRLNFANKNTPLVLHAALLGTACAESGRWLEEIAEPLIEEVQRLQRSARDHPSLRIDAVDYIKLLEEAVPGTEMHQNLSAAFRSLAVQIEPYVFSYHGSAKGEPDGLRAQVLFPDLREMLQTNDVAGIQKLSSSFHDDDNEVATMIAVLHPRVAKHLATAPLVVASPGWPLAFLPQSGADFASVFDYELTEARTLWAALVSKAFLVRYSTPRCIALSADALHGINRLRHDVETAYRENGSEAFVRHVISATIRLAGVVSLLTDSEQTTVERAQVDAVLPLVRWSLEAAGSLFPDQLPVGVKARRKMPAKATLAEDGKRMEAKLAQFPQLSDRDIIRKLARRPRGYWKGILKIVRLRNG